MGAMIPLGDVSRPLRRWPVITLGIIAANAWMFYLEIVNGPRFVYTWSAIPRHIVHGQALLTIVTAMFLHAGWLHIVGNMVFFWAFAPEMEDAMGRFRFLAFYLIGGIVAMSAQIAANPLSRIPNLGASGAIAAVMGAFIVTYPRDRIRTFLWIVIFIRIAYVPAVLLIGFWFLIQLFSAGQVAGEVQTGGVAYLAHIGGFLFGALTGRLWIRKQASRTWQ